MSKKILLFAVLFSLVISMAITQEANALTRGAGQYGHTTASSDPSRVCGNHICQPGENTKWSSAVLASQRQGPGKATGAQFGNIIMHQMVVNTWMKNTTINQFKAPSNTESMKVQEHPTITKTVPSVIQTIQNNANMSSTMPNNNSNSTMQTNSTNTNSTGQ